LYVIEIVFECLGFDVFSIHADILYRYVYRAFVARELDGITNDMVHYELIHTLVEVHPNRDGSYRFDKKVKIFKLALHLKRN
jgi:hypothetical protein